MAKISEIMVRQLPEQHMLTVRKTIDFFAQYADLMGIAITNILSQIEENSMFPSSGPIVCFHNIELENLDVEIGFRVARPVEVKGDVVAKTLPSQIVAVTIDRGPYEKQDPTLEELMNWVPKHGYEAAGGIYYHYLNGEDQPQSEYLTEMFIPVRKMPEP